MSFYLNLDPTQKSCPTCGVPVKTNYCWPCFFKLQWARAPGAPPITPPIEVRGHVLTPDPGDPGGKTKPWKCAKCGGLAHPKIPLNIGCAEARAKLAGATTTPPSGTKVATVAVPSESTDGWCDCTGKRHTRNGPFCAAGSQV